MLDHKQAEFKVDLIALWSKDPSGDASFRMLREEEETGELSTHIF